LLHGHGEVDVLEDNFRLEKLTPANGDRRVGVRDVRDQRGEITLLVVAGPDERGGLRLGVFVAVVGFEFANAGL
jgi:hypothetical protein